MVQSLSALLARTSLDDHDKILSAANEILKSSNSNLEAQHVKLVALLKLEKYEEALRFLKASGQALQKAAGFEKAYALYKVGQFAAAEHAAQDAGNDRRDKHIQAQVAYRLEHFDKALGIYRSLAGTSAEGGEEAVDIRVNMRASEAMLDWTGNSHLAANKKPTREDMSAFDASYNVACGCIARGELEQARVLLKRAIDTVQSSTDLTDEEKEAELIPINTQQLYVFCKEGKLEDAEAVAASIVLDKISDTATKKIAEINILATWKKIENPYVVQKELDASKLPPTSQLFSFQTSRLQRTKAIIDLLCYKFGAISSLAAASASKHPSPTLHSDTNILSVIDATARSHNQPAKEAAQTLSALLKIKGTDVGLVLALSHLLIQQRQYGAATTVLENFFAAVRSKENKENQDVLFAPGLVALLVSLYQRQHRADASRQVLSEASSYWLSKSGPSPAPLLQAAGKTFLTATDAELRERAASIYQRLHTDYPDNSATTAGFIASHAENDKEAHESTKLTAIPKLISGIDISALENAGVPSLIRISPPRAAGKKRAAASDGEQSLAKKKKQRPSRIPKNADLMKSPDLDRWLPLRDRSNYNPKGKKNKAKAAAATQGGMTDKETDKLELIDGTPVKIEKANSAVASKKAKGKKGRK